MRKQLKEYEGRMSALIDSNPEGTDWDGVIQEHLVQISFFQHERLIHLLVTLAFALMTIGCAIAVVITQNPLAAVLMLLLLVLLVPYIVHYYFLENGVQRLYAQYDKMLVLKQKQQSE